MIEEKELYDKVAMVCSDLKLPYYPKLLLVSMVEDVKGRGGSGYVVEKSREVLNAWFEE